MHILHILHNEICITCRTYAGYIPCIFCKSLAIFYSIFADSTLTTVTDGRRQQPLRLRRSAPLQPLPPAGLVRDPLCPRIPRTRQQSTTLSPERCLLAKAELLLGAHGPANAPVARLKPGAIDASRQSQRKPGEA